MTLQRVSGYKCFGAEAGGFNHQVHADVPAAPAPALGCAPGSAAHSRRRHQLRFSTESTDLSPQPAAENTGKHKDNSLTVDSPL